MDDEESDSEVKKLVDSEEVQVRDIRYNLETLTPNKKHGFLFLLVAAEKP